MKITILKDKLKEGINIIERIPAKSTTLPILNNILIKTEKNFLNLSATNLEIGIKWWSLVKVEKEGEILVPVRIFSNFINLLPNKPVTLEVKNLTLSIECDNYKTQIKGFSPEEFPLIPKIEGGESLGIDSSVFSQGLSQVVDIASLSVTRPEISGIYFSFQKNLIKIAATDSFRLGEKKLFINSQLNKEYSLILPQGAAKEIIGIFSEKNLIQSNSPKDLKIYFSPNQILFEKSLQETPHPHIQIISRLIEGEFPNYQEIIPKKCETQAVFQKNEFLNQIKSAALFSGKVSEVKLKVRPKENKIEVTSQSPDLGEYYSFLPGKVKGKEVSASFNHRFLIEGLLNIQGQEALFELNNEEGPSILKSAEDENYIYVVMPVKTT